MDFALRVVSGIPPAMNLKICSHIFMIFKVKLEYCFGHAETGSGVKKRVVLRREIFLL